MYVPGTAKVEISSEEKKTATKGLNVNMAYDNVVKIVIFATFTK